MWILRLYFLNTYDLQQFAWIFENMVGWKNFKSLRWKYRIVKENHLYRTCHSMVYDYNYPTLGLNSQKYLEESHIYDPHW